MSGTWKARLAVDVEYKRLGKNDTVKIPAGTEIIVDTNSSIALIGNDHVDIFADEYYVLSPGLMLGRADVKGELQ